MRMWYDRLNPLSDIHICAFSLGYNPFEFLATGDEAFMDAYRDMLTAWDALTWVDIEPWAHALAGVGSPSVVDALRKLQSHCVISEGQTVATYFDEKVPPLHLKSVVFFKSRIVVLCSFFKIDAYSWSFIFRCSVRIIKSTKAG